MSNLNVNQLGFNTLNDSARKAIFDLVYPIGSYISIDNTDFDTEAKVEAYFGGHWEKVEDGRFLEAGSAPGKHEPGIPNIRGQVKEVIFRNSAYETFGTFNTNDMGEYWDSNTGGSYQGRRRRLRFNASEGEDHIRIENGEEVHFYQNDVYGKSNTVQPKSQVVYIYHRIPPVQNS